MTRRDSVRWALGGLVLASFGGFLACGGASTTLAPADIDTGVDARADAGSEVAADAREAGAEVLDGAGDGDGTVVDADSTTDGGESDATDATDAVDTMGTVGEAGDAFVCLPAISTTTTTLGGGCSATVQNWADEGEIHVDEGSAVTYCTKPPSSGNHYPVWAAYKTYDKPVKYGYLVHDLEHGAVVVYYQCASGSCPSVQGKLQKIIDALPTDPLCTAPVARRVILVPDPALDVAVGAAAWQWTYRATCVDDTTLTAFITAHYAKSAEDTCFDGVTPP